MSTIWPCKSPIMCHEVSNRRFAGRATRIDSCVDLRLENLEFAGLGGFATTATGADLECLKESVTTALGAVKRSTRVPRGARSFLVFPCGYRNPRFYFLV